MDVKTQVMTSSSIIKTVATKSAIPAERFAIALQDRSLTHEIAVNPS
jgi:hypothetical protein